MSRFFRKKPTSVIRTKASKPEYQRDWFGIVKTTIFGLISVLILYGMYVGYTDRSIWLEKLDKTPIKAYALTHKTEFTTNTDIRNILANQPILKGYFGQDIQEIKDKFLSIPWIRDVVVRKVYPDRLSITLIEHIPVAIWNNQYFVSDQGVVFSLPSERFEAKGLPILSGPDYEAKNVLDAWYKIQKDLQSRNLNLKSIETDVRGSWIITLDNSVELRLGRGEWLSKIDRFVTIFPEIDVPEGKQLAYVDLRYEHGAAVGFRFK